MSPEYQVWRGMVARCFDPKHSAFPNYGGRGITVCDYWRHNFKGFLRDMGPRPPGMTIDRIDVESHYMPGNVRWATREEQGRNRRANRLLTHDGLTLTLSEWAERTGVSRQTLTSRIDIRGWSVDEALTTPVGETR